MRQRIVTLIDLGEVRDFEEDPQPPRPAPRWLRSLGVPAGPKLTVVALVVVLCAGLAGTAPRTLPPLRFHVLTEIDSMSDVIINGDVLIQVSSEGAREISAYEIDSGRRLWSGTIGQDVYRGLNGVQTGDGRADGVLVQIADAGFVGMHPSSQNMDRELAHGRATVLDPRTGIQRWQHQGNVISPSVPARTLVMLVAGDTDADWKLVGVDGRDGHDLWSMPFTDGTQWTFGFEAGPTYVPTGEMTLVRTKDGLVSTVDLATGQQAAAGRIAPGGSPAWLWAGYLGVTRPDPAVAAPPPADPGLEPVQGPQRFEVYDSRRLDGVPLWSVPMRNEGGHPWPCDQDTLCQVNNERTVHIDPRTGGPVTWVDDLDDISRPSALGVWQAGSELSGGGDDVLVTVSPQASKTRVGWLGVARRQRPVQVIPLVPLPAGVMVESCWDTGTEWILCPGVPGNGTLLIRRAELEALLAAMSPDGPS